MPLTAEQENGYINGGGKTCLYCESSHIEGDSVEIDGTTAYQDVRCLNCLKSWQDIYQLVAVMELD